VTTRRFSTQSADENAASTAVSSPVEYESVRGTHDRLGRELREYEFIVNTARRIAVDQFGYDPIETPVLQYKHVFHRSLGLDSDVVSKQIFHCHHAMADATQEPSTDSKQVILRPENTASVLRAYLEHLRQQPLPARLFYHGPMFRFERPQQGRLREVRFASIRIESR